MPLHPRRDGALAERARPWPGTAVIDGNLPEATLRAIFDHPALDRARIALVAASPAKAARIAALPPGGAIYLNRCEAEALLGRPFADAADVARALVARGWTEAVVTDGPACAARADASGVVTATPPPVRGGVTGAGDAVVAAHLVARATARSPEAALAAALAAAARHLSCEAP